MEYQLPNWDMDDYQIEELGHFRKHRITQYTLKDANPVPGYDQPVVFDAYIHKPGKPMLIAHPVVGSKHNEIAKLFIKTFCLLGWNGIIVHRAAHPLESNSLQEFEALLRNIVNNDVQVYQFLKHKRLLEEDKTISMGASLGGVSNALLPAFLPYKGFICIVSGGPIAELICRMEHTMAENWRKKMMEKLQLQSVQALQQAMEQVIKTDPIALARPQTNMLFFGALFDKVVVTATQRKLRRSYGRKPVWWFPAGHAAIALFLPVILPIAVSWSLYTVGLKPSADK